MDSKSFQTVSLSFLFVLNIAGIGFLIVIIVNAIRFYINSSQAEDYSYLVKTKLFASQYIPDYLLTAAFFAVIALIIIYVWKQNRSLKKLIFVD
ncbi:MAG: hypothetical protein NWF02_05120 [Candidatus Bathyarchaeota archaeon]|nr:hypothetical protein [Candidatus Bathyarchaeum sp.]